MKIVHRLFVVLLADNAHGKTTMMNALLSQGQARIFSKAQKGCRILVTPWGREIDALVFVRSYQETEKGEYESVEDALNGNDPEWRSRELIILPSHVSDIRNTEGVDDVEQMIRAAHGAGFDAICATVVIADLDGDNPEQFQRIWRKRWDKRWTIPNPRGRTCRATCSTRQRSLVVDCERD